MRVGVKGGSEVRVEMKGGSEVRVGVKRRWEGSEGE